MSKRSKRRGRRLRIKKFKLVELANGRHVFLTKKQHTCLIKFFDVVKPTSTQIDVVRESVKILKNRNLASLSADQLVELQLTASLQIEFPGESFDNALTHRLVSINTQFLT